MPWWGKKETPKDGQPASANSSTEVDKLPPREKLPAKLQKIVDKANAENSSFFDDVKEGYGPDSTDTKLRYAAYATRLRTIMLSAHRYVAYTSDIGESFRPVAHPKVVRAAYGISWLYLIGDVSHEGYRAYIHNQRILNPQMELTPHQQKITGLPATVTEKLTPGVVPPLEDYRTVMVQRGIFQAIASMGLPAFTIHSVVRYSRRALKNVKNATIRTWTPIGLGLAVVPFLPAMFDEPVERAVEYVFHKGFEAVGGKKAVGDAPVTGREAELGKVKKE
ncbi:Mitochondrial 18kDa protein [Beauveria bassiana ARSEF 2860]|uniref:Mitochondrial fission process protein 1 n=1 Tax=Beauveria bassiana (strain ARSEF 2860) TaxID=655819 RepID=J4KPU5_BEAB2|nr:Mitochondrial 18kDa protein [Beauveria bassiana ARSEF 2860]EJP68064.1 Mitochondrial 18kDa protein [Beauveria bassiana ARSEF 2860]